MIHESENNKDASLSKKLTTEWTKQPDYKTQKNKFKAQVSIY